MIRVIALSVILLFSAGVFADTEFVCSIGDSERKISVIYKGGSLVPCEIHYDKGEGAEVLWNSDHTEGFCENHTRQFVSKHEGWGYSCNETTGESD